MNFFTYYIAKGIDTRNELNVKLTNAVADKVTDKDKFVFVSEDTIPFLFNDVVVKHFSLTDQKLYSFAEASERQMLYVGMDALKNIDTTKVLEQE